MVVLSSFLLADQEVEDAILAAAKRKVRLTGRCASGTKTN